MRSYIELASVSEGTYYKYKVIFPDWSDGTEGNQDLQRTLSGTMSLSFGKSYRTYVGVLRVDSSPASGYGSLAKLREWAGSNVYTKRQLYLRDHDYDTSSETVSVFIASPIQPQYLDPMKTKILVPVEIVERA